MLARAISSYWDLAKPLLKQKGELIRCLPENSVAILNEDDPYVKAMDSLAKGKTITYGIERNATCIGSHLRYKKRTVSSSLVSVMTKSSIFSCL